MSFTLVGFVLVFFLCIGLAFVRDPRFGLFAYLWAFYNDPSVRWWGSPIQDFRWSLIAAVVTMLAVVVRIKDQDQTPDAPDGIDATR